MKTTLHITLGLAFLMAMPAPAGAATPQSVLGLGGSAQLGAAPGAQPTTGAGQFLDIGDENLDNSVCAGYHVRIWNGASAGAGASYLPSTTTHSGPATAYLWLGQAQNHGNGCEDDQVWSGDPGLGNVAAFYLDPALISGHVTLSIAGGYSNGGHTVNLVMTGIQHNPQYLDNNGNTVVLNTDDSSGYAYLLAETARVGLKRSVDVVGGIVDSESGTFSTAGIAGEGPFAALAVSGTSSSAPNP